MSEPERTPEEIAEDARRLREELARAAAPPPIPEMDAQELAWREAVAEEHRPQFRHYAGREAEDLWGPSPLRDFYQRSLTDTGPVLVEPRLLITSPEMAPGGVFQGEVQPPEKPVSENLDWEWVPLSDLRPGDKFVTEDGRKFLLVAPRNWAVGRQTFCLDTGGEILLPPETKIRRLEIADRAEVAALIKGTPPTVPDYPHGEQPARPGVEVTAHAHARGRRVDYRVKDPLAPLLRYLDLHPREAAFMRELCERPLDGDTAQIFADWLEDEGRVVAGAGVRNLRIEDGDVLVLTVPSASLPNEEAVRRELADEVKAATGKKVAAVVLYPNQSLDVLPRPAEGSVILLRVPDLFEHTHTTTGHERERELETHLGVPVVAVDAREQLEEVGAPRFGPALHRHGMALMTEEDLDTQKRIRESLDVLEAERRNGLDDRIRKTGYINASALLTWLEACVRAIRRDSRNVLPDGFDPAGEEAAIYYREINGAGVRTLQNVIDHVRRLMGPDAPPPARTVDADALLLWLEEQEAREAHNRQVAAAIGPRGVPAVHIHLGRHNAYAHVADHVRSLLPAPGE